jgi:hypothetical protein
MFFSYATRPSCSNSGANAGSGTASDPRAITARGALGGHLVGSTSMGVVTP